MNERQNSSPDNDLYTAFNSGNMVSRQDRANETGESYADLLKKTNLELRQQVEAAPQAEVAAAPRLLPIEYALDEEGNFDSAKARAALIESGVMNYGQAAREVNTGLRKHFEGAAPVAAELESAAESESKPQVEQVAEALVEDSERNKSELEAIKFEVAGIKAEFAAFKQDAAAWMAGRETKADEASPAQEESSPAAAEDTGSKELVVANESAPAPSEDSSAEQLPSWLFEDEVEEPKSVDGTEASPAEVDDEPVNEASEVVADDKEGEAAPKNPALDSLEAKAESDEEKHEGKAKVNFFRRLKGLPKQALTAAGTLIGLKYALDDAKTEAHDVAHGSGQDTDDFVKYQDFVANKKDYREYWDAESATELGMADQEKLSPLDRLKLGLLASKKERDYRRTINDTTWNHLNNLRKEVFRKIDPNDHSPEEYQRLKDHKRNVALGALATGAAAAGLLVYASYRATAGAHGGDAAVEIPMADGSANSGLNALGAMSVEMPDVDNPAGYDPETGDFVLDPADGIEANADNADGNGIEAPYSGEDLTVDYGEYLSDDKVSRYAVGTELDVTNTGTAMEGMFDRAETGPDHAAQMAKGYLSEEQRQELGIDGLTENQLEEKLHDDDLRAEVLNVVNENYEKGDVNLSIIPTDELGKLKDSGVYELNNFGAAPVDANGNIISIDEARANGIEDTKLVQSNISVDQLIERDASLLRVESPDGQVSYFNTSCKNWLTEVPSETVETVEDTPTPPRVEVPVVSETPETLPEEETTPPPEVTTQPPEVTTPPPEVTTQPPEVTTPPPEETTRPPEVTTQPPEEETTPPPEVTTQPPEVTTPPPEVTTPPPEITTRPPEVTTQPPEITTTPPVIKKPEDDINVNPGLDEQVQMGDDEPIESGELQPEETVETPPEVYNPPEPETEPETAPEAESVEPEVREEEVEEAPVADNANGEVTEERQEELEESGAGSLEVDEDGTPIGNDGRVEG